MDGIHHIHHNVIFKMVTIIHLGCNKIFNDFIRSRHSLKDVHI